MKATLRDLLHAINIIGEDRDVCVDGIDLIAVCPPIRMTKKGQERFQKALETPLVVEYSKCVHKDTYVEESEQAWQLLVSLAGYCASSDFGKWFEGDDAELV